MARRTAAWRVGHSEGIFRNWRPPKDDGDDHDYTSDIDTEHESEDEYTDTDYTSNDSVTEVISEFEVSDIALTGWLKIIKVLG